MPPGRCSRQRVSSTAPPPAPDRCRATWPCAFAGPAPSQHAGSSRVEGCAWLRAAQWSRMCARCTTPQPSVSQCCRAMTHGCMARALATTPLPRAAPPVGWLVVPPCSGISALRGTQYATHRCVPSCTTPATAHGGAAAAARAAPIGASTARCHACIRERQQSLRHGAGACQHWGIMSGDLPPTSHTDPTACVPQSPSYIQSQPHVARAAPSPRLRPDARSAT